MSHTLSSVCASRLPRFAHRNVAAAEFVWSLPAPRRRLPAAAPPASPQRVPSRAKHRPAPTARDRSRRPVAAPRHSPDWVNKATRLKTSQAQLLPNQLYKGKNIVALPLFTWSTTAVRSLPPASASWSSASNSRRSFSAGASTSEEAHPKSRRAVRPRRRAVRGEAARRHSEADVQHRSGAPDRRSAVAPPRTLQRTVGPCPDDGGGRFGSA